VVKKLYVGNLNYKTTEEELRGLFGQYGEVHSVNLIADRDTGRPRGFGFVEMEGADEAIAALNGKDVGGRNLTVNEARAREERGPRGGGGGGGFRGGNRY
jgi:RNA recognition motif-containing protein